MNSIRPANHHRVRAAGGRRRSAAQSIIRAAQRSTVGYEIWEPLDDAQRRLRDAGYQVQRCSDIAHGTPDVLVLEEPGTGVPLHLLTAQDSSGVEGYTPLRPTKLGHVAAFVGELAPMQKFYQELLGFKWSDTIGDFFVFLRCNADHHAANFMASTKYDGMHLIAYEMRDPNHLDLHDRSPGPQRLPADLGAGPARAGTQPVHLWGPINEAMLDH